MPDTSRLPRPGFLFLVCPDSGLIRRRVDALLDERAQAQGKKPGAKMLCKMFWADDGLGDPFWQALTLQGLMQEPKAVLLRQAEKLNTEDSRRLSKALAQTADSTWPLVCIESAWDRGKPKIPQSMTKQKCWLFAQQKGWVWQSPGLTPKDLRTWITDWAKQSGLSLGPGAMEALVAVLPTDVSALAAELEKVRLASVSGEVNAQAAQLISHTPDIDIFSFLTALQRGNDPAALWRKVLSGGEGSGDMVFPFLGLLTREARVLWQLQVGEQVWVPRETESLKRDLARRLGCERLGRIFDLVLEAELGVKTGRRKPDQALEALVADLVRLFGR